MAVFPRRVAQTGLPSSQNPRLLSPFSSFPSPYLKLSQRPTDTHVRQGHFLF